MTSLVVAVAVGAFLDSFLGCLQVINLSRGHRWWAAGTSCCIACSKLLLYKTVPSVTQVGEAAAFLLAGLAGAMLSMHIKQKYSK